MSTAFEWGFGCHNDSNGQKDIRINFGRAVIADLRMQLGK